MASPISSTDFSKVSLLTINTEQAGQRIDNFLMAKIKGVPKSLFYRLLREGNIRVNKKRTKPDYRIQANDIIRIPPLRHTQTLTKKPTEALKQFLASRILYEDEDLLILNKPAGIAVHAGTQTEFGVIEGLRGIKADYANLQLIHRLDRDTSGCLLVAKHRAILNEVQDLFRTHQVKKNYLALTQGHWKPNEYHVELPLQKEELESGGQRVRVSVNGKLAISDFKPIATYHDCTLVSVSLTTGRTHQIRVHAAHLDHAVAGDDKYGDRTFNRALRSYGLHRLFLHSAEISFTLTSTHKLIHCQAPLDESLELVLKKLELS